VWEGVKWIQLAQDRDQSWALLACSWISGFIKKNWLSWVDKQPLASQEGLSSIKLLVICKNTILKWRCKNTILKWRISHYYKIFVNVQITIVSHQSSIRTQLLMHSFVPMLPTVQRCRDLLVSRFYHIRKSCDMAWINWNFWPHITMVSSNVKDSS
jgi:hypothetical protein